MPVRIPFYQQRITPGMVGAPRAQGANFTGAVGAELEQFGREAAAISQHIQKAQREADLTDRIGRATAELAELEFSFERDQDFRTAPQRFQAGAEEIKARYTQDVKDAAVTQAFNNQFSKLQLAKSINVRRGSIAKEKDYTVASLDTSLDVYATQAALARNPAERELVMNQANLAIATLQSGGWISDVDAGNRGRKFLGQLDAAIVTRDMSMDPSLTATKLGTDPAYVPNLDPVARERWIDQGYRRADTQRKQADAEAERERKRRGDELLKEAFSRQAGNKLTREYVEEIRHFVEPSEYKALLKAVTGGGGAGKNDEAALADLNRILYVENDPAKAERMAFQYQKNGLLKAQTLGTFLGTARTQARQEGPRTEYERSKQHITSVLDPGPFSQDPAPKARMGLALRELDDFTAAGKRSDEEIRKKADEIVGRYSLIDMQNLAKKTGLGARNDPQAMLDDIAAQAQRFKADFDAGRMKKPEFDKRMKDLNEARKAAEANRGRK